MDAEGDVNAKKLIKKALKKGPVPLAKLRDTVVTQLVAAGKSEKKAKKAFESKVALPIFTQADGKVSLAGAVAPSAAAPAATSKRAAEDAPATKKSKKGSAPTAAASSSSGAASSSLTMPTMMSHAEAAAYCTENSVTLTGTNAEFFRPLATFAASGFSAKVCMQAAC